MKRKTKPSYADLIQIAAILASKAGETLDSLSPAPDDLICSNWGMLHKFMMNGRDRQGKGQSVSVSSLYSIDNFIESLQTDGELASMFVSFIASHKGYGVMNVGGKIVVVKQDEAKA